MREEGKMQHQISYSPEVRERAVRRDTVDHIKDWLHNEDVAIELLRI